MKTIKDFATRFKCHPHTILRAIKDLTPLFNGFDSKKRKRLYDETEEQLVLRHIKQHHPKLFKQQDSDLSTKTNI